MFGLAEKFGVPVRLLGQMMDSAELTEWMAYYKVIQEETKKPEEQSPKEVEAKLLQAVAGKVR